jgi:radical SAM protein with 4Fe4S-binding SPASM domain
VIVRFEKWGAWVKLESMPALVALDRDGVRALGLDGGAAWDAIPTRPIEVHVAVTSRCAVGCEGCYLDARPDGVEPPRATLEETFDALAREGVFTVAFGGGEPTLRDDIGDLADAARARGLTPVVTTSGLGLGDRKLERLARFAQVNVSYDGTADVYADVRGVDGASEAESAIERLAARGIPVGINVVLTRKTFDRVRETLRRARELGASEAQLLRYKPQGRARSIDYLGKRLSPVQARALGPLLRSLSKEHAGAMRIRIDCALVPFLSADPSIAAEDLRRWGVLGCEAGALLGATRIDGTRLPCSFAPPEDRDAYLAYAAAPEEPCASCALRDVCRGGCKVVSSHVSGRVGPDPECPRVRA